MCSDLKTFSVFFSSREFCLGVLKTGSSCIFFSSFIVFNVEKCKFMNWKNKQLFSRKCNYKWTSNEKKSNDVYNFEKPSSSSFLSNRWKRETRNKIEKGTLLLFMFFSLRRKRRFKNRYYVVHEYFGRSESKEFISST